MKISNGLLSPKLILAATLLFSCRLNGIAAENAAQKLEVSAEFVTRDGLPNLAEKLNDRDVLVHDPDLVLVEFAVNDGDRNHTLPMERIVHKTWLKNPKTDIVFFYTLSKSHLDYYKAGNLPPSASAHERVAIFYGLPTVGTGFAAAQKILNGEMKWEDFSADSCHPKPAGYAIFNATFLKALPEFLKTGVPKPHATGKSITPNLQVYPLPSAARPLEVKEPLVTAKGKKAVKTYPMPVVNVNWVKDPEYQNNEGKTLWRLSWLSRKEGGKLDATTGADRKKWESNLMTWFAEDNAFTGPYGTGLITAGGISASLDELAVLRFICPVTGRYCFKFRSQGIAMWQNDDKSMSMNVLKFAWDGTTGQSLSLVKQINKRSKGFVEEVETKLTAGEEVVFIPDLDAPGYIGGTWKGFTVTAGLLGE